MKNWQFWVILSVNLIIGFICIDLLFDISETIGFISSNVVDLGRDTYSLKEDLATTKEIISDLSIMIRK